MAIRERDRDVGRQLTPDADPSRFENVKAVSATRRPVNQTDASGLYPGQGLVRDFELGAAIVHDAIHGGRLDAYGIYPDESQQIVTSLAAFDYAAFANISSRIAE